MTISLDLLFRPSSVAVVGASTDPRNLGNRIVRNLVATGFHGAIYPVHPRGGAIADIPIYGSIDSVPEKVSLCVVCVPRQAVLDVVDQCSRADVRIIVVVSAGFAETDADGAMLQESLAEKAREKGLRIVGPNCVGIINSDSAVRLNTTFCSLTLSSGPVALCSQSGAIGVLALAKADVFNIRFSHFVSVGNEVDVSSAELLEYWGQHDQVEIILLYLESIKDAKRFREAALAISRKKRVVAIKAGREQAGTRAARSHTAALSSGPLAVDALLKQTGIVRADGLDEMLELAALFSHQPLPEGARVAVITNAGGPAVLCADACAECGLDVPVLSHHVQNRLAEFLAPPASVVNPIDMLASAGPEQYRKATELLLACDAIDALIVIYVPVEMVPNAEVLEAINAGITAARSSSAVKRPVVACVMSKSGERIRLATPNEVIPCCVEPASSARMLGRAAAYAQWRRQPIGTVPRQTNMDLERTREILTASKTRAANGWLPADLICEIGDALGLPLLPGSIARDQDQVINAAQRVGFPVAVKTASAQLVHKTEVGAVELQLNSADEVRVAFDRLSDRVAQHGVAVDRDGVLVQPMCTGIELLIGATRDPQLGPLLAFGLGGTRVEIVNDVCHRLAPLTDREASDMVRSIRGYKLLTGYRGGPPTDIAAIEQLLLRLSHLMVELPEVCEIDFNPVVALPQNQGCRIVDARIRIQQ